MTTTNDADPHVQALTVEEMERRLDFLPDAARQFAIGAWGLNWCINESGSLLRFAAHLAAAGSNASDTPPSPPGIDESRARGATSIQIAREEASIEDASLAIIEWMMDEGLMRHRTPEDDGLQIEEIIRRALEPSAPGQEHEGARVPIDPDLRFGLGKLVIDVGTFYSQPAVFLRPVETPGPIGELAADQGDLHSLASGEKVWVFPTIEQARAVRDALVTPHPAAPRPSSQGGQDNA